MHVGPIAHVQVFACAACFLSISSGKIPSSNHVSQIEDTRLHSLHREQSASSFVVQFMFYINGCHPSVDPCAIVSRWNQPFICVGEMLCFSPMLFLGQKK